MWLVDRTGTKVEREEQSLIRLRFNL